MRGGGGRGAAALLARVAVTCAALRCVSGGSTSFACATAGRDAAVCAALGDIYAATGGASWGAQGGWRDAAAGQAVDYCGFFGVTCDAGGAVTQLVLNQNGLVGTLPPSLSALRNLTALDVSDNLLQGTVPPGIGALTSLTSLMLSHNILRGTVPTALAGLTALRSLGLETNTFNGTLPAFLGALPQLTALYLATNYFTGAVPASLGERGLSELTLGSNMLDSASFPASLCPFACAAAAPPFLCPVAQPCGPAPGAAACRAQCMYPACPVTGLSVADFAFTRDKCAIATPQDSCLVCLPAIMAVFYMPPASVTDLLTLDSCLVGNTPLYLAAGAQPSALALISNCGSMYGFRWGSTTCPVALPTSAFASLARSCANAALTCTSCVADILRIFRAAGADASTDAQRVAQYDVLNSCMDLHLVNMVAAGADAFALAKIKECPSLAGFLVLATMVISGVSASSFSAGIFSVAVAAVVNVRPSDVTVQNFTDVAAAPGGGARRRLRTSAVNVRVAVSCASAAQQQALAAALRQAASSFALTSELRQGGLPATSAVLLDITLSDGPPAPAALAPPAAAAGRVAGAVAGAVLGTLVVVAIAAAVARRRRMLTLHSVGEDDASSIAAPGSAKRSPGRVVPPFFLDDASYSRMPAVHSDDDASSGATWRAVTSAAAEVQLRERVGEGAFAVVHRASWRGSEVAVKLWDQPPDGEVLDGTRGGTLEPEASFLREVQLLSSLRHPNILAIYAVVKQPPMMIMEFGAAGSLKDLLARSSLATLGWGRRMVISTSVASAVEFLHAQSPPIIHTDLKAGNIVLTGNGMEALVPKVADFGVSWVAPAGLAARPFTRGTPRYMAPEVARCEPITNSKAIDAYGMGMVLFDVAHVNTAPSGHEETPQEHATTVVELPLPPPSPDGEASASGAQRRPWCAMQVLFERESAGYVAQLSPHVPPPLRSLMRDALAVEPDERPHLPQLRLRLEELTLQAPGW